MTDKMLPTIPAFSPEILASLRALRVQLERKSREIKLNGQPSPEARKAKKDLESLMEEHPIIFMAKRRKS